MARTFATNKSLSLADVAILRGGSRALAVLIRVKRDTSGVNERWIGKDFTGSSDTGWGMETFASNLPFLRVHDGTTLYSIAGMTAITDTNWHNIGAWFDPINQVMDGYQDGTYGGWTGTNDLSAVDPIGSTGALYIGSRGGADRFFTGTMGEVCILVDRIPTVGELDYWNTGICGARIWDRTRGLVACWTLVGDSLVDIANTTSDLTLTAVNSPTVAADPTILWPMTTSERAFASDTFAGAADTALEGRTPDVGSAWAEHPSYASTDLELDGSGALRRDVGSTNIGMCYINEELTSRAFRMVGSFTTPGTLSNGFVLCGKYANDANTGIDAYYWHTATEWRIAKRIAGSGTVLSSRSVTLATSTTYTWGFECAGNRAVFTVDNQLVCVGRFVEDSLTNRYGYCGIKHWNGSGDGWLCNSLSVEQGTPEQASVIVGTNGGNSGDTYAGYHIPALGVTNDYIIAALQGRSGGVGDADDADLVIHRAARPYDGTWGSKITVIADGTGGSASFDADHNPVIFTEPDSDTVRIVFTRWPNGVTTSDAPAGNTNGGTTTISVWMISSTDQGATWGSPVEITSQVAQSDWAGKTVGPGKGVVIPSGTYAGRMLFPLSGNDAATHTIRKVRVAYSDDNGSTWSVSEEISSGVGEAENSLTYDSTAARLYLLQRISTGIVDTLGKVIHYSDDGGATWTELASEAELFSPDDEQYTSSCFSSIYYDTISRRLLISGPLHSIRQGIGVRYSGQGDATTWDDLDDTSSYRIVGGNLTAFANQAYSDLIADPDDATQLLVLAIEGDNFNSAGYFAYSDRAEVYAIPRTWIGVPDYVARRAKWWPGLARTRR